MLKRHIVAVLKTRQARSAINWGVLVNCER